jgi:transcriptional repressor NrdR
MRCPFCKVDDDRVVDSRASNDGFAIRRRRECVACDRRYTTYERIEESPLRVVKKDQRREPFERRKILLGLIKACEKRPIPIAVLEGITERIENRVLEEFDSEVPVTYIGQLVMDELKKIDQVAYVRFASVYREFQDIHAFLDELKGMLGTGEGGGRKGSQRDAGAREGAAKEGGGSKGGAPKDAGLRKPSGGKKRR